MKLRWAFTEKPTELYDIVCHVLENCTYDVILGSKFLAVTETFSKHLHRLVKCAFNVPKMFHLNLLDGGHQTLSGKVGGHQVFASPDTGAERNVMDLEYVPPFFSSERCSSFPLSPTNFLNSAMRKRSVSIFAHNPKIRVFYSSQTAVPRKQLAKCTRFGPSPPASKYPSHSKSSRTAAPTWSLEMNYFGNTMYFEPTQTQSREYRMKMKTTNHSTSRHSATKENGSRKPHT